MTEGGEEPEQRLSHGDDPSGSVRHRDLCKISNMSDEDYGGVKEVEYSVACADSEGEGDGLLLVVAGTGNPVESAGHGECQPQGKPVRQHG